MGIDDQLSPSRMQYATLNHLRFDLHIILVFLLWTIDVEKITGKQVTMRQMFASLHEIYHTCTRVAFKFYKTISSFLSQYCRNFPNTLTNRPHLIDGNQSIGDKWS